MSTQRPARTDPPLFWGRRLPNFAGATVDGSPFELYRDVTRGPVVVLANPPPEVAAIAVDVTRRSGTGANVVALGGDHAVSGTAPVVQLDDPGGQVRRALFAGRDDLSAVLVADANQRGVDAFVMGDDLAERLGGTLCDLHRPEPQERRATAPVMVLPNLIDDALRADLIAAFQARNEEGTVSVTHRGVRADTVVPGIKRRRDLTLERGSPLYAAVRTAVADRLMPELYKTWWVTKLRTEAFYVAGYSAERQDFFAAHRDNTLAHTADRRIAISIELNDDYAGGGLVFPEYSEDRFRAPAGGGVAFSCSLMHEAVPITEGTRFVLLVFLAAA